MVRRGLTQRMMGAIALMGVLMGQAIPAFAATCDCSFKAKPAENLAGLHPCCQSRANVQRQAPCCCRTLSATRATQAVRCYCRAESPADEPYITSETAPPTVKFVARCVEFVVDASTLSEVRHLGRGWSPDFGASLPTTLQRCTLLGRLLL
jgi:hypothetical protein